jgi:hypothetical protein
MQRFYKFLLEPLSIVYYIHYLLHLDVMYLHSTQHNYVRLMFILYIYGSLTTRGLSRQSVTHSPPRLHDLIERFLG